MEGYDIFVPEMKIDSKYSVSGAECQVLSVALKPGEKVESEPGAMMVSRSVKQSYFRAVIAYFSSFIVIGCR
jgi:hypothetical protein